MKAIFAGAVLFGVALGGLTYVNSSGSKYSWLVAAVGYLLALFLVPFLHARTTLKESARFNAVLALMVTGLFLSTLWFCIEEPSRT